MHVLLEAAAIAVAGTLAGPGRILPRRGRLERREAFPAARGSPRS